MAAMLAAAGVFLYVQFRRDLLSTIDAGLRARTGDIVATAVDETDPNQLLRESDERLAQVYAVGGRVLASSRGLRGTRLLAPDEARRAAAAPVTVARRAPAGRGAPLKDLRRGLGGAMAGEGGRVAAPSHELRTPLSVLRAEVDLALRGRR